MARNLTGTQMVAAAKAQGSVRQSQANTDLYETAQANGGMINGLPVTLQDGKVVYDVAKIGQAMGMTPEEIQTATNVRFPKATTTTRINERTGQQQTWIGRWPGPAQQ